MSDTWTKKQVKTAFVNLLKDSQLFTRREEQDLDRLVFSIQDLATMLGGKVEALKKENKGLREEIVSLKTPENTLFPMNKYVSAPPNWKEAYRRAFLNS